MATVQKKILAILLVFTISFSFLAVPQPVYASGGGSGGIINTFVTIITVVASFVPGPWQPFAISALPYVLGASAIYSGITAGLNGNWLGVGLSVATLAIGFDASSMGNGVVSGFVSEFAGSVANTLGVGGALGELTANVVLGSVVKGVLLQSTAQGLVVGGITGSAGAVYESAFPYTPSPDDSAPNISNTPAVNPSVSGVPSIGVETSAFGAQDSVEFDPTSVGIGLTGVCPEGYYNSQNKMCVPVGNQSCLEVGIQGACPAGYTCSTAYGGSCSAGRAKQPDVIVNFSTTQLEPSVNKTTVLSWSSIGATYCAINNGISGVFANGYLPLSFSKPGIWDFVIRCAGEGGEQIEIITINIPPVIAKLNTNRTFIAINSPFTLAWTSSNARACSINNQFGTASLHGSSPALFKTVGDKTITLICNGRGGTTSSSVNIKVVTEQEYLDTMTRITTAPGIIQVNDATLDPLTAPTNPARVPQPIIDSLTSTPR